MINTIGNFLIILTILLTILIIYYSLIESHPINKKISKVIFNLSLYQVTTVIICFFTLIFGFIISDFSLITVYQNSHSLKPLFYKISGTWGNHEGSLLLWVNVLIIFSYLFLIFNKPIDKKYQL